MPARSVSTWKFSARSALTTPKRKRLGEQPADAQQDHDGDRQARQEGADLQQKAAHRLEHDVDVFHARLLVQVRRVPASAAMPASGTPTQSGRLSIS